MKKGILIYITLLLLCGCKKTKQEISIDYFNSKIGILTNRNPEEIKGVIVIPNVGCTGCIDESVLYVKKNLKKLTGVQVVFTSINDPKLLKLKLAASDEELDKMFFDVNNEFSGAKVKSPFPQFLILSSGKVTKVVEEFNVYSLEQELVNAKDSEI